MFSFIPMANPKATLIFPLKSAGPGLVFETLLNIFIATPPQTRLEQIKPHLTLFFNHLIIKELLEIGNAPAIPPPISNNLELQKIQNTLSLLTKAIEGLKKASTTPNKPNAPKPSKLKDVGKSSPTPCTYLAIARSRPPNPSLVVDLAKYGSVKGDWVKPDTLCHNLNEKLSQISPP
jgi:hypothetical protein